MPFYGLLDIFHHDPDGDHSVVVQDFPASVNREHLENYLEVICKQAVIYVFVPKPACGVAVVVFGNTVKDIEERQNQRKDATLEGSVPTLHLLGRPHGIYLQPDKLVTEDFLELYFESRKSGGEEESVKDARIKRSSDSTHAVVRIQSQKAITSILNKADHQLKGTQVQLQPYYPEVHDRIIQASDRTTDFREAPNVESTYHKKRSDSQNVGLEDESENKRYAVSSSLHSGNPDGSDRSAIGTAKNKHHTSRFISDESKSTAVRTHSSNTTKASNLQILYQDDSDAERPISGTEKKRNDENMAVENESTSTTTTFVPEKRPNKKRYRNRAQAVKPFKRNTNSEPSTYTTENNNKPGQKKYIEPSTYTTENNNKPGQKKCTNTKSGRNYQRPEQADVRLSVTEDISLPSVHITMLKIYHFQDKYQTENLKFELRERSGTVTLRGYTNDDLKRGKLHIHECLDSLKCRDVKLSNSRLMLLKQEKSQNCLRTRCKMRKVKAAFSIDDDRKLVLWYGFNDEDTEKGCQLLDSEISTQSVDFKEGQTQLVHGETWKTWVTQIDLGLSNIFVDEQNNCMVVESFLAEKAKDIADKVRAYLKQNIPKRQIDLAMEGARARCFQARLRRKITQLGGTCDIVEISKSPLKIQAHFEGDDSLMNEVEKLVKQMYHEEFNFDMVSTREQDTWLMLRGLNDTAGLQFVQKFQKQHTCFIDVVQIGPFVRKRPRTDIDESMPVKREQPVVFENISDDDENGIRESFGIDRRFVLNKRLDEEKTIKQPFEESLRPTEMRSISLQNDAPATCNYMVTRSSIDCSIQETRTVRLGQIKVVLMKGILVEQKADVLVNMISATGSLTESVVSKSFIQRGGPLLQKMYDSAVASASDPDVLVKTDAPGRLPSSVVLHVRLNRHDSNALNKALKAVLEECGNSGYSTVAMPPLGVGRMYGYPARRVAEQILKEISVFTSSASTRGNLGQITVVVYRDDEATYRDFNEVFASCSSATSVPKFISEHTRRDVISSRNLQTYAEPNILRRFKQYCVAPSLRQEESNSRDLHEKKSYASFPIFNTRSSELGNKHGEISNKVQKGDRKSRMPEDPPVSMLKMVVFAENKDVCVKAIKALGKEIKNEFLHEEFLKKSQKISSATKQTILKVIFKYGIASFKEDDGYVLKGQKENVSSANKEILQVLLEAKESVVPKKLNKENVRRGTREFAEKMFEEEPEVPPYWKNHKRDTPIKTTLALFKQLFKGQNFEKVSLASGSPIYETIVSMINSTFDPRKVGQGKDAIGIQPFSRLFVVKIQRIENIELFEKFARQRQSMYGRLMSANSGRFPVIVSLPNCSGEIETVKFVNKTLDTDLNPELNETFLFHGTKRENIRVICNSGFEHRLASENAMFGQGIYGAECSLKADQYADSKTNRSTGRKKMFLVRMLLGNAYLCSDPNPHKYRKPPCTTCYKDDCRHTQHASRNFGHFFDSVVGDNKKLFREFVVYDSALCYPEYLITYERR